jgi:hypothetical protein
MSTTNLFRLSGRVECSWFMQGGDPSPSRRPAKSGGQIRSRTGATDRHSVLERCTTMYHGRA